MFLLQSESIECIRAVPAWVGIKAIDSLGSVGGDPEETGKSGRKRIEENWASASVRETVALELVPRGSGLEGGGVWNGITLSQWSGYKYCLLGGDMHCIVVVAWQGFTLVTLFSIYQLYSCLWHPFLWHLWSKEEEPDKYSWAMDLNLKFKEFTCLDAKTCNCPMKNIVKKYIFKFSDFNHLMTR